MSDERLLKALANIPYPGFSRDIVSFGLVRNAQLVQGKATVELQLTTGDLSIPPAIKQAVEAELAKVSEVKETEVRIAVSKPQTPQPAEAEAPPSLQKVRHVIAVASGKGGVGKSTAAVNLACALSRQLEAKGKPESIGIMDCDIYGPSIPLMLGAQQRPEIEDDLLMPVTNFGIRTMSMGILIDEQTPVVWRGPMIMKTIQQFATQVNWGELEILVIDLPPGTGDAQLSLVQTLPLDGAVIVTTPQLAAVQVARRGARMFEKVSVPLLGVIENMSYLALPDGSRQHIFGEGGGARTAEDLETGLLAQIPLDEAIREGCDRGIPIVIGAPESHAAQEFAKAASHILSQWEA